MSTFAELGQCTDIASLRAKVADVSAAYGALKRLDILTAAHEGRHQAICFMRMQTRAQEEALMKSLGLGRFEDDLVLVVDLPTPNGFDDDVRSSQWAESVLTQE